jgi:hypothetical protein
MNTARPIPLPEEYRASIAAQEVSYFKRTEWTRQQIDCRLTIAAIKLFSFEQKPPELESTVLFWEGVRDGCNQRMKELETPHVPTGY